ncbi:nitronate monooxygenase family protein [Pelagibius sp. Alg239-R121]|uniref:NAD(P)H-dependent flavin oxidoreductase n=1 Tax=Pelagibius sp. Alg239-R121 TaxID=2993448 RepID=UPI0024A73301|nr:nitronate monooxygenase [Pelagibius sp. Alg239-R121]
MWPDGRLRRLFKLDAPIIQAPMAGSSSLDMAIAVSEAGGLGSLACALQDAATLERTLDDARSKTGRSFNVNFFAHQSPAVDSEADAAWLNRLAPYYEELLEQPPSDLSQTPVRPFDSERCSVIEQFRPKVVSFHFGLPAIVLVERLKAAGVKVISTATTVEEALWLEAQGCDAIIAQGYEAGGHRGMFLSRELHTQIGTMALVPQVVDAVDIPVIAAGGIADGRGICAAIALGASGVQLGTAYLQTEEAQISSVYREALTSAQAHETSLTDVVSGRPTRCLMNRVIRELGPISNDAPEFPKGFTAMSPLRMKAEGEGRCDFSAHYCGQAAALGAAELSARLTGKLIAESIARMKWMAGREDETVPECR